MLDITVQDFIVSEECHDIIFGTYRNQPAILYPRQRDAAGEVTDYKLIECELVTIKTYGGDKLRARCNNGVWRVSAPREFNLKALRSVCCIKVDAVND